MHVNTCTCTYTCTCKYTLQSLRRRETAMGTYLSSSSPRQMIMRCRYCLTPACSTEHWTLTSRACRNTGRGWRHVAEEQRHHSTHHYTTHWSLHLYTLVTKALTCRVGVQVLQGTKQHYYFTMQCMYMFLNER